MKRDELKALAAAAAEKRLRELMTEVRTLAREFPEIHKKIAGELDKPRKPAGRSRKKKAKRQLSDEARAALSDRTKRMWETTWSGRKRSASAAAGTEAADKPVGAAETE